MEKQLPAAFGKRKIPKLIEDDTVNTLQLFGKPPAFSCRSLLLQFIGQIHYTEITDSFFLAQQIQANRYGKMGLAGAEPPTNTTLVAERMKSPWHK